MGEGGARPVAEQSPCLDPWEKLLLPEGCKAAGTIATLETFKLGPGTARWWRSNGVPASEGVGGDDSKASLPPDRAPPALFSGHLVLAGDAWGHQRGDERRALLGHRDGPAAVSETWASALLPRLRELLGRGLLHRE